ncbi:MAG: DNRLRE domain-containing protein, partial [Crocinitomicaceae bacterium]|nr:DNRLRE domain-containing protein [Crocinitomicaceae bacterium]
MKYYYSLLTFLIVSTFSFSQTVNLNPVEDNSIYSDATSNSSGLGKLYAGETCAAGIRRALLKFDLSTIPAGATITSVTLDVNVDNVSTGAGNDTYNIHPLTLAFGEGTSNGGGTGAAAVAPDATWNDAMFGTSTWTTPGGDFLSSVSTVVMNISLGAKTFPTSGTFETLVQTWLDNPASNFGIMMIGNETTTCTARRFGSKDQGTVPVLNVTYTAPPCTTAPTAVCQNVTAYLDGGGNTTILASDLDGGSVDNCGTPGLTFSASQTAFTCADVSTGGLPSDALIITGVIDGPLSGGTPKAVELYVASNIADLSMYGLGCANNGGGTDGEEFTFPSVAVTAGQFIYVATDSIMFNNWFGFFPNYTTGSATNNNGDDAIELFYNSSVADIFGDINVDGTGEPWEHLDGWAYRNSSTGPDGSTFVLGSWSFSGVNALDLELTNASASVPFPTATFVPTGSGTSVTLTVTDGNLNTANCVAMVTVLDTITPTASQPVPVLVQCIGDVPAPDPLIFTDEADNCGAPIVAFVSEVSNGLTCPEAITRTYSITDASGNSINVDHIIVVIDDTDPVMNAAPANITVDCIGDVPQMIDLGYTDNCDGSGVITGTDV